MDRVQVMERTSIKNQGSFTYNNPALSLEDEWRPSETGQDPDVSGSVEDENRGLVRRRSGMELRFRGMDVVAGGQTILQNIAGTVLPGEILALMGPSGSGKTTLLSVLSGRLPPLHGSITIGDRPLDKSLRRSISYVMQQDLFFSTLTLLDTLMYQAHLKLPSSLSTEVKRKLVTGLAEELDIAKCYNTAMGSDDSRGLSGGEKKRANIACELLSDPVLMLLDEPTSGLDSSTAHSLCQSLRTYAGRHRKTVVLSVHQPSPAIFQLFDKVLLVSQGQIAYYGFSSQILEFFASVGLHCEPNYNPADFILDKAKETPDVTQRIVEAMNELRKQSQQCPFDRSDDGILEKNMNNRGNHHRELRLQHKGPSSSDLEVEKWASTFWTQYNTLLRRNLKHRRPQVLSWLNVCQTLAVAVISGLIWWQHPKIEENIHARAALLYFVTLNWAFVPMYEILTSFPMERPVINKERLSGTYRLSAYYLAKSTGELPLVIVQPLVAVTITFWMAGLNGVRAYFITLGVILLSSATAQSIGLFISACFLRVDQSIAATSIFMLSTLLLGGFYIQHLPHWLSWATYLAFVSYPFHVLLRTEFADDHSFLCKSENSAFSHCNLLRNTTNTSLFIPHWEILNLFNVTLPVWAEILTLLLFFLAFRGACYLVLRTFRKP